MISQPEGRVPSCGGIIPTAEIYPVPAEIRAGKREIQSAIGEQPALPSTRDFQSAPIFKGCLEPSSGNRWLKLLNAMPKRLNDSFPSIFRHTQPLGTPNTLKDSVTQAAHDLVDSLARQVMGGPFEVPGLKVIDEEFDCEYEWRNTLGIASPGLPQFSSTSGN